MKKRAFLELFIVLLYFQTISTTRIRNLDYVRSVYKQSYIENENPPDSLCGLTKEIKVALCIDILKFFHEDNIHPNKIAMYLNNMDCERNKLLFFGNKEQDMIPCFANSNPIRTKWDIDDYYRFLYVSGGPSNNGSNSLFLYYRTLTIDDDIFAVREIIENIQPVNSLTPVVITSQDINEAMMLNEMISYNLNIRQIETNYYREQKSICDLDSNRKFSLCSMLLKDFKRNADYEFKLDESFHDRSSDCVVQKVKSHVLKNLPIVEQRMFPCYGRNEAESETVLYLADGYRERSILVYMKESDAAKTDNLDPNLYLYGSDDFSLDETRIDDTFISLMFIENVNFTDNS